MKPSLRQVLADSHIAAVAIALFLVWAMVDACRALWGPVVGVLEFLVTAVAIRDIPYFSPTLAAGSRARLVVWVSYLYLFLVHLSAAWLLSKWVYGMGPLRGLDEERRKLTGRKDA